MNVQHMAALQLANEVRAARMDLKRRVKAREITVAAIVVANERETVNMPVSALLIAQPRWGFDRVRRFLKAIPMSESRTVGDLTDRQREQVVSLLDGGAFAVRAAEQAEALRQWAAEHNAA